MKKIIVIEPGSAVMHISDAIRALGYEPTILCSLSEYNGEQKEYLQNNRYYEVDAISTDNIISCIVENKIENILGIISTADRFITQACETAIKLGVLGPDKSLLKLNDKSEVASMIPEYSPQTIIFNKNNIPVNELKSIIRSDHKIIIKPVSSAGGKGMFELCQEDEVNNIIDYMLEEKQVDVIDKKWLAQPFIDGELYSIEGFVIDGTVHYIGLSHRSRIGCTETQNIFPSDNEIKKETHNLLKKALEKLVEKSNYRKGYFHCEFLSQHNKVYLIDANFGRVGGGCIALQIARSFNKDIKDIYAHVVAVTLSLVDQIDRDLYISNGVKTLSILYGVNIEATFIRLQKEKLSKNVKHIQLVENGVQLVHVGLNNRSWVGILIGETSSVLEEIKDLYIETDKGLLKPIF